MQNTLERNYIISSCIALVNGLTNYNTIVFSNRLYVWCTHRKPTLMKLFANGCSYTAGHGEVHDTNGVLIPPQDFTWPYQMDMDLSLIHI